MNMFDEINDNKKDLPRLKTIEKEVGKYQFNGYQKFAIVTYILCFTFGIIVSFLIKFISFIILLLKYFIFIFCIIILFIIIS